MSELTQRDEVHANAWQCTAELARQVSLLWAMVEEFMPAGPQRQMVAGTVVDAIQLLELQDVLFARMPRACDRLIRGRPCQARRVGHTVHYVNGPPQEVRQAAAELASAAGADVVVGEPQPTNTGPRFEHRFSTKETP